MSKSRSRKGTIEGMKATNCAKESRIRTHQETQQDNRRPVAIASEQDKGPIGTLSVLLMRLQSFPFRQSKETVPMQNTNKPHESEKSSGCRHSAALTCKFQVRRDSLTGVPTRACTRRDNVAACVCMLLGGVLCGPVDYLPKSDKKSNGAANLRRTTKPNQFRGVTFLVGTRRQSLNVAGHFL